MTGLGLTKMHDCYKRLGVLQRFVDIANSRSGDTMIDQTTKTQRTLVNVEWYHHAEYNDQNDR